MMLMAAAAPPHAPTPPPPAADKRAIAFIFATIFLDLLGVGILVPVIPFFVRQFRDDALTVGLLAVAFSAAQFIATPVLGALSDRHGRRPILLFSLAGNVFGFALFGWANALWLLYVARLIEGITGGNISTAQAYIADVTRPEDRSKNFGLIGAAFGLGFILGPAIGGVLSTWSLHAPAYGAAVFSAIATVFGYFALPESLPPERRTQGRFAWSEFNPQGPVVRALGRAEIRPLLLAVLLMTLAFSGLQTNFALFTMVRFQMGPAGNAAIFAFIGVIIVLMQGVVVRRLTPRFSDRSLSMAGLALLGAGFLIIAFAPGIGALYAGCGIVSAGSGLTNPTVSSQISAGVAVNEQGAMLGASQALASLARVFGPVWAGLSFDHIGQGAPYWSGAICMAAAWMMIVSARRLRGTTQ